MLLKYHCRGTYKFLPSYHVIAGIESTVDTGFWSDILIKTPNADFNDQNDRNAYV